MALRRAIKAFAKPTVAQSTSSILMIRPVDFKFNEESAKDNEFMKNAQYTTEIVHKKALDEFDTAVQTLKQKGINILTFDKSPFPQLHADRTPD
jgi:hypothetical protein